MSLNNDLQVARDVLVAYIMLSEDFKPTNPTDMKYLWNISYSFQWGESTRVRFAKDVEQLSEGNWTACRLVIPDPVDVIHLKKIFSIWSATTCNFPLSVRGYDYI